MDGNISFEGVNLIVSSNAVAEHRVCRAAYPARPTATNLSSRMYTLYS